MKRKSPQDDIDEYVMIKCKRFIFAPKENKIINFCCKLDECDNEGKVPDESVMPDGPDEPVVPFITDVPDGPEPSGGSGSPVIELIEDLVITPIASKELLAPVPQKLQITEQSEPFEPNVSVPERSKTPEQSLRSISPVPDSPEENRMLRKLKISDGVYTLSQEKYVQYVQSKLAVEEEKKRLKQQWEELEARVGIMARIEVEMKSQLEGHFNASVNEIIAEMMKVEEVYKAELGREREMRNMMEGKINEMAAFIQQNMSGGQSQQQPYQQMDNYQPQHEQVNNYKPLQQHQMNSYQQPPTNYQQQFNNYQQQQHQQHQQQSINFAQMTHIQQQQEREEAFKRQQQQQEREAFMKQQQRQLEYERHQREAFEAQQAERLRQAQQQQQPRFSMTNDEPITFSHFPPTLGVHYVSNGVPISTIRLLEQEEEAKRWEDEKRQSEERRKKAEQEQLDMERQKLMQQHEEQRRLEMRKMQHLRPKSSDMDDKIKAEQNKLYAIQEEKIKTSFDPFALLKKMPNVFGWKNESAPQGGVNATPASQARPATDNKMETDSPTSGRTISKPSKIDLSKFRP